MSVVVRGHVRMQRAATQDVVAGERHQHGVLHVVIKRIAVPDAFERDARDRRDKLDKAGLRRAVAALHVFGEKVAERVCRKFRNGNHGACSLRRYRAGANFFPAGDHPMPLSCGDDSTGR